MRGSADEQRVLKIFWLSPLQAPFHAHLRPMQMCRGDDCA
jgi:hypothetical protein